MQKEIEGICGNATHGITNLKRFMMDQDKNGDDGEREGN
jgi:hypothetical protein